MIITEFDIKELFYGELNIAKYSRAIYKGGSRVDPVIEKPHDYDYICFAKSLLKSSLLLKLRKHGFCSGTSANAKGFKNHKQEKETNNEELAKLDLSQVRGEPYTKITWFSYLDPLMEKVVGDDCCPKTDVIVEHRQEFYNCIYEKMIMLQDDRIKNQKRWYHLLRGIYILINNSYEVNEEQKKEINTLHQLSEGWEEIKNKTVKLITEFKV